MSIQFVLGRSGSGKSRFCFERIISNLQNAQARDEQLILLVPEQSTYLCEKEILTDSRVDGYSRLHILSFERLCFWLGVGRTSLPHLSSLSRDLIVSRILSKESDNLEIFSSENNSRNIAPKVSDILVELQKYENTPSKLSEAIKLAQENNVDKVTLGKLKDIEIIYSRYLEFIDQRYINHDASLTQAQELVASSSFLKGAKIWVDGFSSFNAQERSLLVEILKVVSEGTVAFCLDPKIVDALGDYKSSTLEYKGMFSPTIEAYCELKNILAKINLEVIEPVLLTKNYRHTSSKSLCYIEENIFCDNNPEKIPCDSDVRVLALKDIRNEVDFVAREITRLLHDKEVRYRDIAVIVPDIDTYSSYINTSFSESKIPFFIDQRKSMSHNILVELLCSAMTMSCGEVTNHEVSNYFKTSLSPLEEKDWTMLENFALEYGFQQRDWIGSSVLTGSMYGNSDYLKKIERLRRESLSQLLAMRDKFEAGNAKLTAYEFSRVVFEFMESLSISEKLTAISEDLINEGREDVAREYAQLFSKIIDILDEMNSIFGEDVSIASEYAWIFSDMISDIELSFVPPKQDQVTVGSVERSRHPKITTMFLLGATNTQFPISVSQNSLLGDKDRLIASSLNLELSAQSVQKLLDREYLAYIAYTRSSESLYITMPRENSKGVANQVSPFVKELIGLFEPPIEIEDITSQVKEIYDVYNNYQLSDLFCSLLSDNNTEISKDKKAYLSDIFEMMKENINLRELVSGIEKSLSYKNNPTLAPEIAHRVYSESLMCSVSRISNFAACPFKHFASYTLRLSQRKKLKLDPIDVGNFYHRVLEILSKELLEQDLDFGSVESEELKRLTKKAVDLAINESASLQKYSQDSLHNSFVIDSAIETLNICTKALSQMSKAGNFELYGAELKFGDKDAILGECVIEVDSSRKLKLCGVIDRLDLLDSGQEYKAIVFDYKRRAKKLNWAKLFYGLDMQLIVYLIALDNMEVNGKRVKPIGGFFVPVEIAVEKGDIANLGKATGKFPHKSSGVLDGEYALDIDNTPNKSSLYYDFRYTEKLQAYAYSHEGCILKSHVFNSLIKHIKSKLLSLGSELISGNIRVNPYRLARKSSCEFCDFKSLCRFDVDIDNYNDLAKLNKRGVIERLEAGQDEQ